MALPLGATTLERDPIEVILAYVRTRLKDELGIDEIPLHLGNLFKSTTVDEVAAYIEDYKKPIERYARIVYEAQAKEAYTYKSIVIACHAYGCVHMLHAKVRTSHHGRFEGVPLRTFRITPEETENLTFSRAPRDARTCFTSQ